jgi:hypothetical protein
MEHMQQLADKRGLNALRPRQDEVNAILSKQGAPKESYLDETKMKNTLSMFKSKTMQQRIINGIQMASHEKDRDNVEQLIEHYSKFLIRKKRRLSPQLCWHMPFLIIMCESEIPEKPHIGCSNWIE